MGADSARRYRGRPSLPRCLTCPRPRHRCQRRTAKPAAAALAAAAAALSADTIVPARAADRGGRLQGSDEALRQRGWTCFCRRRRMPRGAHFSLAIVWRGGRGRARHGCTAVAGLCRTSAERQASAAALGVFAVTAACARAHPSRMVQACAAIEALCTGKGAAARREQAVAAGWLELLCGVCSSSSDGGAKEEGSGATDDRARLVALAALRSITRDSMGLQQKALDAGADRQWLRRVSVQVHRSTLCVHTFHSPLKSRGRAP